MVMMYHHPLPLSLVKCVMCPIKSDIVPYLVQGSVSKVLLPEPGGEGAGARLKEARDQNVGPLLLLTPHQSVRTKGWVAAYCSALQTRLHCTNTHFQQSCG